MSNVFQELAKKYNHKPSEETESYIPSGSLVFDAVISKGKGIPTRKFIEISSKSGVGKCVTGDTKVLVNNTIYSIEDVVEKMHGYKEVENDMVVNTNIGNVTPSHMYHESNAEVLRVITKNGQYIKGSKDHPLLVTDKDLNLTFKELKEIKPGDMLVGVHDVDYDELFKNKFFDNIGYAYGKTLESTTQVGLKFIPANSLVSVWCGILESWGTEVFLHYTAEMLIQGLNLLGIYPKVDYSSSLVLNVQFDKESLLRFGKAIHALKVMPEVVSKLSSLLTVDLPDCYNSETLDEDTKLSMFNSSGGTTNMDTNILVVDEVQNLGTKDVYDFTLPDVHSFNTNAFISHNTTTVLHFCKMACIKGKKVVYLDIEKGVNDAQLEGLGLTQHVDSEFFLFKPSTFEEVEEILDPIFDSDDDTLAYVVVDSITALLPEEVLSKSIKDVRPGIKSQYDAIFFPKYKGKLERSKSNATFIFINQTRVKMNFRGQTTESQAGGNAQQFYPDIRLTLKKAKSLIMKKQTTEGVKEVPYGADVIVSAIKNRHNDPGIEGVMTVHFGKGISNIDAYHRYLMYKGALKMGGAGFYTLSLPGHEDLKARGLPAVRQLIKDNLESIKAYVDANGGFQIVSEEEED